MSGLRPKVSSIRPYAVSNFLVEKRPSRLETSYPSCLLSSVASKAPCVYLRHHSPSSLRAMSTPQRPVIFRGLIVATPDLSPAHCSAPPLQADFRLPCLQRDVEAVTRPRAPLRPLKWEDDSSADAVVEFRLDIADALEVKVEAAEAEEEAEAPHLLCARMAAVRVSQEPVVKPRGPGRPKGSKSRPRVKPEFDTSAPPERDEARKARARWARGRK